jgi:predicted Fe-Mo cluster-binding NifX family protein
MTLISLEEDRETLSERFRKAPYFAFLDKGEISIQENRYKTSKSNQFFDYFNTLNIDVIYIKKLGYKTFLRLETLGVKVYLVKNSKEYNKIKTDELLLIDSNNAQEFCTLGHHKK